MALSREPVRPGFDMDILGIRPLPSTSSLAVSWAHYGTPNWTPVLDIWRQMVGGNLTGTLEGAGLPSPLRASVSTYLLGY